MTHIFGKGFIVDAFGNTLEHIKVDIRWEQSTELNGCIDFFPVDFDKTDLICVTAIGDSFNSYLNKDSELIKCEDFYNQAHKEALGK